MSYPATKCFLVVKVNVRKLWYPAEGCSEHTDCHLQRDREEPIFDIRREDTNEVFEVDQTYMRGLPPGSMYWEQWGMSDDYPLSTDDWSNRSADELANVRDSFKKHPEYYKGPCASDPTLPQRSASHIFAAGMHLIVVCPNGHHWNIDSRASNCTMPYEYNHRCWVRHGEPPMVTVDKNGVTCQAGGGSILAQDYHGFLQNGILTAG